ncbi:MAG: SIMPL domain-containing protein [Candidatus Falkowbacteria bacterium]
MNNKWEPRHFLVLLAILAITGVVTVSILRDRIVNQQFKVVTLTGRGKVDYQPDQATVSLGVQIDKKAKAEEALNELNTKIAGVRQAMTHLGVKDENIDTKNYSLYTQYDYKDNIQVVSGYSANQQLDIKIINLKDSKDLLNKVIIEAGKAGANQVNGVTFTTTKLEDYKQEARIKAIEDAKAKASRLAGAAGVALGDITNWYENQITDDANPMIESKGGVGGGASAPMPAVSTSGNQITMEIGVSYNIK